VEPKWQSELDNMVMTSSDIESQADKPVPNHFRATGGEREDLRMAPVMRVKTNNPWVRLHLERLFINKHNLVEDGINNVL